MLNFKAILNKLLTPARTVVNFVILYKFNLGKLSPF